MKKMATFESVYNFRLVTLPCDSTRTDAHTQSLPHVRCHNERQV